jgi:hypothetical protein
LLHKWTSQHNSHMRRQHQQRLGQSAHRVALPTCNALVRVTCAVTAVHPPVVPDVK